MTTRLRVPLGIALAVALTGVPAGFAQNEAHERPAPRPTRAKARSERAEVSPAPTQVNVAYGPHERNVLDVWQAKSHKPTPLAIFIHGGGFIGGSKEQISVGTLRELLDAGISVAAVNYRLISHAPLPAAHNDCARAVQFLRSKAEQWNLHKKRFAAFGGSAGAQLAMYLAFHDDLADPKSDDPISRESTRLACVAPSSGQVTMDFDWWMENVPGYDKPLRDPLEPFGAKTKEEVVAKNKEIAALELISKDDPPVFMSYGMAPGQAYPDDPQTARNWKIHHVVHGVELKKLCDKLGVECHLKYPGASTPYASTAEFLKAKLLDGGAADRGITPEAGTLQTVHPPEGAKPAVAAAGPRFRRTRVIGYSQVGQPRGGWFVAEGVFELIVGDDRWELLWHGGAGVDKWRDPDYTGWAQPLVSPCPGDAPVDRVLLSVSGPYGDDEKAWAEAIDATVAAIRKNIPTARQIILQAVVGGPDGKVCPAPASGRGPRGRAGGGQVRASWQHKHIVSAIRAVAKAHAGDTVPIIAGYEPKVRSCDDYADALGHLTREGAVAAARAIGERYASLDAEDGKSGHVERQKARR
jgi:acetyl esterase/lipase